MRRWSFDLGPDGPVIANWVHGEKATLSNVGGHVPPMEKNAGTAVGPHRVVGLGEWTKAHECPRGRRIESVACVSRLEWHSYDVSRVFHMRRTRAEK